MQRTLVLAKPDAVQRGLIGEILTRFERKGLKVVGLRLLDVGRPLAEEHYAVHAEKHFYAGLVEFITSGPVVVQVLEGEDAVALNRKIMGATNPKEADEGTIRRELAESIGANSVHGSDSLENAAIEIDFFFTPDEIVG